MNGRAENHWGGNEWIEFKRSRSCNIDQYDIQYYNPDSADYGLIILGVAVGSNATLKSYYTGALRILQHNPL